MSEQQHSADLGELALAVAAVMSEAGWVPKDRTNDFHRYSYTSDAALTAALRPAMAAQGLALLPVGVVPLTHDTGRGNKGDTTISTYVHRFKLVHKSGQWMDLEVLGSGSDSLDKAPYKAATGALKYALRQLFLISTGDDPDADGQHHGQHHEQRRNEPARPSHHPSWEAGRVAFCAALSALGTDYDTVADWTDAQGWGRPSGWSSEHRRKLHADIAADPDHAARKGAK